MKTRSFLATVLCWLVVTLALAQSVDSELRAARALLDNKNYAQADKVYSELIARQPDLGDAYIGRAEALIGLRDLRSAVADFDRAARLLPRDTTVFNLRGTTKKSLGDLTGAMADFDRAIELNPRSIGALQNRASLHMANRDPRRALADYDAILALHPESQQTLLARGWAKIELKDGAGAERDFSTLLKINPEHSSALMGRAKARETMGDPRGALEDYLSHYRRQPQTPEVQQTLKRLQQAAAEQTLANASSAVQAPPPAAPPAAAPSATAPRAPTAVAAAPRRVLAPFKGYSALDPCANPADGAGAPWREGPAAGGPLPAAQMGAHEALLRLVLRNLRLLHGPLSATEEKNFNALWAPLSDSPTTDTFAYLQHLAPLLDELLVTLTSLDGLLPGLGEALEGVMLTRSTAPGSNGAAALQASRVKAERARLQDLQARIEQLGNPPNPLAAKCAARKRHQQALAVEADVWKLLRQAQFLGAGAGNSGVGDLLDLHFFFDSKATTQLNDMRAAQAAAAKPQTRLTWSGRRFAYTSKNRHFDAPCTRLPDGSLSSQDYAEIEGEVSGDGLEVLGLRGRNVQRTCEDPKAGRFKEEASTVSVPRAALHLGRPTLAGPERIELVYTNMARPPAATDDFELKDGEVYVRFANFLPSREAFMCVSELLECALLEGLKKAQCEQRVRRECEDRKAGRNTSASVQADAASRSGQAKAEATASGLKAEEESKALQESIKQHEALAAQTQKEADRWAAEASRETKPERKKELQALAANAAANAQAERDIAESLRTGVHVRTRTAYDEQQHQAMIADIRKELAGFDAQSRFIANLPKVAEMVTGVEGVELRRKLHEQMSSAIRSPDSVRQLAELYVKVQDQVIEQGDRQIQAAQDRVALWDQRIEMAENTQAAAAAAITLGAIAAPAQMGALALGYAGATGFVEGGVKGATVAVVRSVSSRADVLISAYEGATRVDPQTGQPRGAQGAIEGALESIVVNKVFDEFSGRLHQARTDYAGSLQAAGSPSGRPDPGAVLRAQAAGGAGFKPAAKAGGEGRIREFDFLTPEQRYQRELNAATTPREKAAVSLKYAIVDKRMAMAEQKETALQRAREALRRGTPEPQARDQYNRELEAIDKDFEVLEVRNERHQAIMKELKFDSRYDRDNVDIKPTGGKPRTAESDMDFAPVGKTPQEAYAKGKAYAQALQRRGSTIQEYGDRWVDATNDITIWKPGFGADNPGSSSFQAEVIFGTLPDADKFGTSGGVEWTRDGSTPDVLGAVLANAGKAVSAGLGNSRPPDLHIVGKSLAKTVEITGVQVDPVFHQKLKALKAHQTPEQAGVVDIGADPARRAQQVKAFMDQALSTLGRAVGMAKSQSDLNLQRLAPPASARGDQAHALRARLKAYQAGNEAAMATIARVSPGMAAQMGRMARQQHRQSPWPGMPAATATGARPQDAGASAVTVNIPGLVNALSREREQATKVAVASTTAAVPPALSSLRQPCQDASKTVAARLAAAKPGSDQAKYLAELKAALDAGAKDPAQGMRMVRSVSGFELPVVLEQLGIKTGR